MLTAWKYMKSEDKGAYLPYSPWSFRGYPLFFVNAYCTMNIMKILAKFGMAATGVE